MKREIKFRAWDNTYQCWYEPTQRAYEGKLWELMIGFSGDLLAHNIRLGKDEVVHESRFPGRYELNQLTGLKDKNGKDIYEGDILKIEYFRIGVGDNLGIVEIEETLTGKIVFTGLTLVLENIIGEKWGEYTGYDQGEGNCKIFHLHDVYEGSVDAEWQIEVIGNIYENPELLK